MKKRFSTLLAVAVLATIPTFTADAATQVYDLKTGWSDTQNPNGTWSYRLEPDGGLLQSDRFPWAVFSEELGWPIGIARTTEALVLPGHLESGDIFVIAGYPGGWVVTVRWTAPASGTINISGTTWLSTPDFWTLTHNGNVLSGDESYNGKWTRDLPKNLSSGSGGATALQNIAVEAGDHIEIAFSTWTFNFSYPSPFGRDPAGLNFTIFLTTDSVDPVAAIEDLAIAVFEMNLQNGIENSLDSKLDAALDALVDANFNNDGAACSSLAAFINAVQAQRDKKITNAQADELIATAQQIKAMLDCGN